MTYEATLRKTYAGLALAVDDLYLLDAANLATLRDRVTPRALAAALRQAPALRRVWTVKHPPVEAFLDEVQAEPPAAPGETNTLAEQLVWEIAELIVYHRYPEQYDDRVNIAWDFSTLADEVDLEGRVVADVGAGAGRIAFQAAPMAKWVFAVEPVDGFRRFMRRKATEQGVKNLYVIDGTLAAIPLPDGFLDVLATCQAFAWSLPEELAEIERVVRPGGAAIHMSGMPTDFSYEGGREIHDTLVSDRWGYVASTYRDGDSDRFKYAKRF